MSKKNWAGVCYIQCNKYLHSSFCFHPGSWMPWPKLLGFGLFYMTKHQQNGFDDNFGHCWDPRNPMVLHWRCEFSSWKFQRILYIIALAGINLLWNISSNIKLDGKSWVVNIPWSRLSRAVAPGSATSSCPEYCSRNLLPCHRVTCGHQSFEDHEETQVRKL